MLTSRGAGRSHPARCAFHAQLLRKFCSAFKKTPRFSRTASERAPAAARRLRSSQHSAQTWRRPCGRRRRRCALRGAHTCQPSCLTTPPPIIVFPHMRPYAPNSSSSLTAALQRSPTNHDLLPRGSGVVHIPDLEGSCPSALPLCKSVRHER